MRPAGRDPRRMRTTLTSHNSRTIGFLCRYPPILRIYTRIFHCVSDGQQCIPFLRQRSLSLERFLSFSFSSEQSGKNGACNNTEHKRSIHLVCLVLLLILLHEDLHRARGEHHSNGRTVMAPAGGGGGFLVGGGGSNTAFNRPGKTRAWRAISGVGTWLDEWVCLRSYWWTLRWDGRKMDRGGVSGLEDGGLHSTLHGNGLGFLSCFSFSLLVGVQSDIPSVH